MAKLTKTIAGLSWSSLSTEQSINDLSQTKSNALFHMIDLAHSIKGMLSYGFRDIATDGHADYVYLRTVVDTECFFMKGKTNEISFAFATPYINNTALNERLEGDALASYQRAAVVALTSKNYNNLRVTHNTVRMPYDGSIESKLQVLDLLNTISDVRMQHTYQTNTGELVEA